MYEGVHGCVCVHQDPDGSVYSHLCREGPCCRDSPGGDRAVTPSSDSGGGPMAAPALGQSWPWSSPAAQHAQRPTGWGTGSLRYSRGSRGSPRCHFPGGRLHPEWRPGPVTGCPLGQPLGSVGTDCLSACEAPPAQDHPACPWPTCSQSSDTEGTVIHKGAP